MPQFTADEAQVASHMAARPEPEAPPEETAPSDPPAAPSEPEPVVAKPDYREFDPKHKEAFSGLLYVGQLDDEFMRFGHKFRIVTPSQTERLQVGPIIKEFRDTITAEIAFQTAIVALYLQSVDDQPLPQPIMINAKDTALRDRFNWVSENMRRQVIYAICDQCMILDDEVDAILDAMGKASA
jgi:hypothetical protein